MRFVENRRYQCESSHPKDIHRPRPNFTNAARIVSSMYVGSYVLVLYVSCMQVVGDDKVRDPQY